MIFNSSHEQVMFLNRLDLGWFSYSGPSNRCQILFLITIAVWLYLFWDTKPLEILNKPLKFGYSYLFFCIMLKTIIITSKAILKYFFLKYCSICHNKNQKKSKLQMFIENATKNKEAFKDNFLGNFLYSQYSSLCFQEWQNMKTLLIFANKIYMLLKNQVAHFTCIPSLLQH